jgi:hypothetical protein
MSDWVIAPQSATTLYIYRVERSCPCWSWKPNKSRAKIQLRLGLQCPYPVKPPRPRGLTAPVTWRPSGSHISLIRTPNWTFDLLDETYPMGNGEAQITFWGLWLGRSNRVTGRSNRFSPDLLFLGVNSFFPWCTLIIMCIIGSLHVA